LLSPASVALVGATESSNWSHAIVRNLRTLGYAGAVYLVHPTKERQFDAPCYPSLRAIPDPVDHAWVMTPTHAAAAVLADCAAKGVRSVTMLTSGFKEVGPEGAALEREITEYCRVNGITLLGPNCLGFVNAPQRIPAYALLLGEAPVPGHVGVVLQSGAMLVHVHKLALRRGIGLNCLVSSGNEAMVDATDFLQYLVQDPETHVLAALLEGIRDPERFARIARQALAAGKPMVVLKTGRSRAGSRSAAAHTGALTGDDQVVDAYLRGLGVIRVSTVEEMVETAGLLQARGWPSAGRRTAVVTPSGGACGIFADLCEGKALELPDFRPETKERLRAILPEFGTPMNPLDTTGFVMIDGTLLPRTLAAVAEAPECDLVASVYDLPQEPGPFPERTAERLKLMSQAVTGSAKYTCLVSTVAGDLTPFAREAAARYGLHSVNGLAMGATVLSHAVRYGEFRRDWLARQARAEAASGSVVVSAPKQTDRSDWDMHGTWDEARSKALLAAYGIPTPREITARSSEEAVQAAETIGGTVVLKVLSPDLPHKTEAGGVALNLTTPDEVRSAYFRILDAARAYKPDARIEGVLVAEQVTGAVEMFAGIAVDPHFGPVVVTGLGGIFVEVFRDVAMRLPPFDRGEALAMLGELKGIAILQGARGGAPADVEALADVLVSLGRMALDLKDRLKELDLNPLLVLPAGRGVKAVDALAAFQS
jgi:acyl-CoA synthetase (NDP forming)